MKKIMILIILIAIPIGLEISESLKKPLLERVEKDGYTIQPKDSLWEYVKFEVGKGSIDPKINFSKKYQEPILLNVENATTKDSLAVDGFMQELKYIFPLKEVAYFSDFVGQNYSPFTRENSEDSFKGYTYDELVSFTTHFSFDISVKGGRSETESFHLKDRDINIKYNRKLKWNKLFLKSDLVFGFKNGISIMKRQRFISDQFFKLMWSTFIVETVGFRSDYRRNQTSYIIYNKKEKLVKHGGYIEDKKFLIQKMFSKNFEEQFEEYMYKTYPWRYANIFIDKDNAKQDANAIVGFIGLLILIISCSFFWFKKEDDSFLSYFLGLLILYVGFSSLGKLYAYLIYIDQSNNAIAGILGSLFLLVLITVLFSFVFWKIEKTIISNKVQFGYQLLLKLVLTFLVLYLPSLLMTSLSEFIESTGGTISRSLNNFQFFIYTLLLTFGRGLLLYLNHFSESLVKQKDVELSQLKEINAQAEVKLLQSQINPHFLYNALNSIATLARKDGEKTEKMALSLSDLFKYTINRTGKNNSTIQDEVEMVQNYLEIEQIRFGDRLHFSIEVSEELKSVKIPMFIIQPLIENAVKHGISKNEDRGEIALKIEKNNNGIEIIIEDNGPDFPEGLVSGHGLQTVYDLLRLSYGDGASMHWRNKPEKQIVIAIKV